MSDRAAFLAAICAQPDDDTARLVFADWLDEHGDAPRAEFVRTQIAMARDWPDHVLTTRCRCETCQRFRRLDKLATPARRRRWAGAAFAPCSVLRYYRGFVETVELPLGDFMRSGVAGAIFGEHPVTAVVITDRVPQQSQHDLWGWFKPNGLPDNAVTSELPLPLYEWLHGGVEIDETPSTRGARPQIWYDYPTRGRACWALSEACVRYGRPKAGLSPFWDAPAPQPTFPLT